MNLLVSVPEMTRQCCCSFEVNNERFLRVVSVGERLAADADVIGVLGDLFLNLVLNVGLRRSLVDNFQSESTTFQ